MIRITRLAFVLSMLFTFTFTLPALAGVSPYREPAPAGDHGPQVAEPVFGPEAGQHGTDHYFVVAEWVAKRTWHNLGLDYERTDYQDPPAMNVERVEEGVVIAGTVARTGIPLRNFIATFEIEQRDEPVLVLLRSTDAFGEVMVELDLHGGTARARSVTVSRSMIGGQSHSSPMPEESSWRVIREDTFEPTEPGFVEMRVHALGARVVIEANGREIFRFLDPDVAAGQMNLGSTGAIAVRNVQQWELITPGEQTRRETALTEMRELSLDLDADYDNDVRKKNTVTQMGDGVMWTYNPTGATVRFTPENGLVRAVAGAGLYGNDTLADGAYPEIAVIAEDGATYGPDPDEAATIEADDLGVTLVLPLRSELGDTATARVRAQFTVQTVWFWTVEVEGADAEHIQAYFQLTPEFGPGKEGSATDNTIPNLRDRNSRRPLYLKHNAKSGFYMKGILADTDIAPHVDRADMLAASTTGPVLRFATVLLPAQPLNLTGFKSRMVHYIKYPEGPVQDWRREPSFQEYPTNTDLRRFAGKGADAMVWHHTWISNDYRDREGWLVNHDEMKRAMRETHRLGMKTIGYIGIVPGRHSLIRLQDTCPLFGNEAYGIYDKNWDLQDFTFFHCYGRAQEFIPWITDYYCKEYGLDGYYLDGFGLLTRGGMREPYRAEDADLSLDEIRHRMFYRIKKVLERNDAGYGLEPWSGLDWMINGFYDCMMIGESFQEAPPESYRDSNNALLTGCTIKMYGMRESSQNPYNIAMAGINLSDIQVCSGNGAWGDVPDTSETWARVSPLWDVLDSIDYDDLVEARPWYAQELVSGEGFYAGNYTTSDRAVIFLANETEEAGTFDVKIDVDHLPPVSGEWRARYLLNREGDLGPLGDGRFTIELPALHDGPIALELVAK